MADQIHPFHDHERTEMSVRTVLTFAIALIVGAIVIHFIITGFFKVLESSKAEGDPISPLAGPRTLPPKPRLQVYPPTDLRELRSREDFYLNHYSWGDKKTQTVRIPIDRAMGLLVERGVPGGVNEPTTP